MQLSKYCDGLLRKTGRTLSDADLEEKFNDVITIFSYIEDKDVFQRVSEHWFELFRNFVAAAMLSFCYNPKQVPQAGTNSVGSLA